MPYLQCPQCGLSNWSTHRQCLRCCTPLEGLEGFHAPQPSVGFHPLRKRKVLIGVALIALLVIGGSVLTYSLTSVSDKKGANPNAALEAAIRNSSEFNVPVVAEAGRYKFYNQDEGRRIDQEATPEAYVLDSLGLLYIHHGMYADAPMTRDKDGGYSIDPLTRSLPYQYKHVELEITRDGQTQSAVWEPYENKKDAKDGWKVPIGERELVRVVQVVKNYLGQPISDAAWVSFTWRWKPNDLGKSFDKRSPTYRATNERMKYPTSPFAYGLVVHDSQAFYWGTADLTRGSGGWEAHNFSWAGPEGITLAPDISDEAHKLIEEAKSH